MHHAWFTVGHSTRSVEQLVELLHEAGADLVADVRTVPRSRTNPQFNTDTLPADLVKSGIGYRHLPRLGGLRGRRKTDGASANDFWDNASFRNYADYATTQSFSDGMGELRALGQHHTCAIMCAEAVWWRCHRRIITDYLIAAGEPVRHILAPGHIVQATMTPAARLQPDGRILYPARTEEGAPP